MKKLILIFIGFVSLFSQEPIIIPRNKIDAQIKVKLLVDTTIETLYVFTYQYTVKNLPTSEQKIWCFRIPLAESSYTSKIIEVNGPPYWWDEIAEWILRTDGKWVPWDYWDSIYHLKPGDSLSGFSIKTYLFPDTGNAYLEGYAVPPTFFEEPPENWEDSLGIKYWSLTPYGPGKVYRTLGFSEKPPLVSSLPGQHYPNEAFRNLYHKLTICYLIDWIDHHIFWELRRILDHALNHIENGRLEQSKRTLTRLMRTIKRLNEQGRVKDEVFYILYYRTKYVRDNLWYRP